ncbi:MAG: leucine-rich repeat domain-containing protein [Promethearchaeota archaeon]
MKFQINRLLSLHLEGQDTIIYVNNKRFDQCKRVMIQFSKEEAEKYKNIGSIDEAVDIFRSESLLHDDILISPEEEFWGHCSNLQAWVEQDYNTRILHSNLSFPLLKALADNGDEKAKKIFKSEIAERFSSNYPATIAFLIKQGFLNYFNAEEIEVILLNLDYSIIYNSEPPSSVPIYFKSLFKLPSKIPYEAYLTFICKDLKHGDYTIFENFVLNGYFNILEVDDIDNLLSQFSYEFISEQKLGWNILSRLKVLNIPSAIEQYKSYIESMVHDENNLFNITFSLFRGEFSTLEKTDIQSMFKDFNYNLLMQEFPEILPFLIQGLVKYEVREAVEFYKSKEFISNYLILEQIDFYLDIIKQLPTPLKVCLTPLKNSRLWKLHAPASPSIVINGKKIIEINLSYCEILDIPQSIKKITSLEKLNLKYNSIKVLPELLYFKNLREVNISYNLLETFNIQNAKTLESLDLKMNQIKSLNLSNSSSKNLILLDISRNYFKHFPSNLCNLPKLKWLNLSFNQLIELPNEIGNLSSLTYLNIDYNNIRKIPQSIKELKHLKVLSMEGNILKKINDAFLELISLNILSLNKNRLDDKSLNIIGILGEKIKISSPPYKIRFSPDASNVIFWGFGENTKNKYGYNIKEEDLPISNSLLIQAKELYREFNNLYYIKKIGTTPSFIKKVNIFIEDVRAELGSNFEIHNQFLEKKI